MGKTKEYWVKASELVVKLEKFNPNIKAAELFNFADRVRNPMPCRQRGYIRTFPVIAATSWYLTYWKSLNRSEVGLGH